MANRPSNRERNEWTLSLLDLQPADKVLEIGFGPGIAVLRASEILTQGRIAGIDHSRVMLDQAGRRNRKAIEEGRVVLRLGDAEELVDAGGPFDKIYSINVVQFWKQPVKVFRLLQSQLKPRGIIATTYQPRHAGATRSDTEKRSVEVASNLELAGFSGFRIEHLELKPIPAVCVLTQRSLKH